MNKPGINRREFLRSSGTAAAGVAATATGAGALISSAPALALVTDTLNAHEAKTLLAMTRQMFPHDFLADQYYAGVVTGLDTDAGNSPETAKLLSEGIAAMDAVHGVPWVDLSEGYRLKILNSIQDDGFFGAVKGKVVGVLYNDPLVWRHFGYEGEAFTKGGYVNRGFNDLTWLPDPPEDASPKAD